MNGLRKLPLSSLVMGKKRGKPSTNSQAVWNLNLDQIEPHTGRVLEKVYADPKELGSSTYPFERGTVLYSKLRPYLNKVVVTDDAGIATTELVPLQCNKGKVLPEYLAYFLRSPDFLTFATTVVAGAKMPRMVMSEFWSFEIPVPPLPEQRRIAAILDKVDALRAKRREALAQLDSLTQSIFIEMFGDPVTNPLGWKSGSVQDALDSGLILNIQDGNHGELHPKVSDFSETGIPFIMANCLSGGKLNVDVAYRLNPEWLKKLRVGFGQPNDVLLSHKGTVGEVAIVPSLQKSIILSPQVTYYRTGHLLNSQFLAGYFKTAWFQAVLKKDAIQSTRAYIGITRQRSLPLIFPPLELQQEYARKIDCAEGLTACCTASLSQLDALFSSLQHRAFRGER